MAVDHVQDGARLYHLRDLTRLAEALRSLISNAPESPWGVEAKTLQDRLAKRAQVKPHTVGAVLPMSGKYKSFGETTMRGLQLALKGSDIELVVKDLAGRSDDHREARRAARVRRRRDRDHRPPVV